MTTTESKQLEIYFEMNTKINKETLRKIHKDKMLSATYCIPQNHSAQIIEILGGINTVLEVCLNSNDLKLTDTNKLDTLHQIITTKSRPTNQIVSDSNKIVNNTGINIKKEDCVQFEYTFDENDTFLHSILDETKANKIQKLVEHKIVIALSIMAIIIGQILYDVYGEFRLLTIAYNIAFWSIFVIPWLVLKHTLFNKNAFKLCLKTFHYWIKISYGILYVTCEFFYDHKPGNRSTLGIIQQCSFAVVTVLVISFISSFDAFVMSKKKKLVLCGVCVILFTWFAVEYQFLSTDESDYKIEIQLNEGTHIISMISLMSSSSKILCIFFWKQMINTFQRKGKAISLRVTPTIKWINSNQNKTAQIRGEKSDNKTTEICLSDSDEKEEININSVSQKTQIVREVSFSIDDMNSVENDEI